MKRSLVQVRKAKGKSGKIPVVGSSAKMTEGLAISSHASERRFFSPPLIPRTFASPTIESAQLTYATIEPLVLFGSISWNINQNGSTHQSQTKQKIVYIVLLPLRIPRVRKLEFSSKRERLPHSELREEQVFLPHESNPSQGNSHQLSSMNKGIIKTRTARI